MDPEAVAARIWLGRELEVEALGGGITNRNFKVSVDGEAFVLRIGGKDTELLGIDRSVEHDAARAASDVGVAPEVVAFVEPDGYLVTRFVEGRPVPVDEMRTEPAIRRAVSALRAFHETRPIRGRFDSFRVVEAYAATASAHEVPVPADYQWAKERAGEIEASRGSQLLRPCHNDLLNANFIDDGDQLWIVDWEYAGMGDLFFDLANFSINHEFGDEENDALLAAYFGAVRPQDVAALARMRLMSDFREAMWGVVQQGISELEFDFEAYADEHFARLHRTAGDSRFREALLKV